MGLDNPLHIAVLVVILLLVFGAKRLPELGRSLGSGMREFKDSITGSSSTPEQPTLPAATQQPVQPPAQAQPQAQPAPPQAQPAPPQAQPAPPQQTPVAQGAPSEHQQG